MPGDSIEVDYNDELKPLSDLLSGVKRPGDFYATGSLVVPMPRLDIDGVGTVSFPVPQAQAREIIQHAEQAPYGKGSQTLIDPNVRKVWQVAPGKIRLGGMKWEETLANILAQVTLGLGCQDVAVSAELYKLLLYDPGSFFIPHRDTEKTGGMFGTLVVVLPSFHRGGELIIRHAGREVSLDLSTQDVSQLTYAAFYADCEHEIRPITEGNRVCLIYNLIQQPKGKGREKPLTAPDYDSEIAAAAEILKGWGQHSDTPPKIVYLLEHQYTPASLSFGGLKNADAALAKVLSQAASTQGFAVHLGIVHIEESGSAQPLFDPYSRRSRWGRRYHNGDEDKSESEDYEIIDVSDSNRYISDWKDLEDRAVDFGKIPLGEYELLPEGALEGQQPDKQSFTEATGNEGGSFERAYHRAAIVVWQEQRYPEVLLQAGVGATIPYLKKRLQELSSQSTPSKRAEARDEVISLAKLIIDAWEAATPSYRFGLSSEGMEGKRAEMLGLLQKLGDTALVHRFIETIVSSQYDGSENQELAACARFLGPQTSGDLLATLVDKNMPLFHRACVDLERRLLSNQGAHPDSEWLAANRKIAEVAIQRLAQIGGQPQSYGSADWWRAKQAKPVDKTLVEHLFEALGPLAMPELGDAAAAALVARPQTFVPDTVLVPALTHLHQQKADSGVNASACFTLWKHSAEFLLTRSEFPPEPPKDWAQPVKIEHRCADCRELETFAADPEAQVHRFRVRQDRRQHLHGMIEHYDLDMTHQTERVGSPQTLVCTKTRRKYQQRCKQYAKDIEAFQTLLAMAGDLPRESHQLSARLKDSIRRAAT